MSGWCYNPVDQMVIDDIVLNVVCWKFFKLPSIKCWDSPALAFVTGCLGQRTFSGFSQSLKAPINQRLFIFGFATAIEIFKICINSQFVCANKPIFCFVYFFFFF